MSVTVPILKLEFAAIAAGLLFAAALPVFAQTTTAPAATSQPAAWRLPALFGSHKWVASSETEAVPESSGVVASRISRDIYWTHNDEGGYPPRVYAFRLTAADRASGIGKDMGYVELPGAQVPDWDWEDIAAGPGNRIYVFDGGDNDSVRKDKGIIRFVEPAIDPAGQAVRVQRDWEYLRFEYPDPQHPDRPAASNEQRYDAECLFVHPTTGDIYLVTKRDRRNRPVARVFKLAAKDVSWSRPPAPPSQARASAATIHVLQFVADISQKVNTLRGVAAVPGMVTAGDIDFAGRHVVIRNYIEAYEFTAPEGKPFDAIFEGTPRGASLAGEPQGEGICYTRDGKQWVTTSEILVLRGKRFPIFTTDVPRGDGTKTPE